MSFFAQRVDQLLDAKNVKRGLIEHANQQYMPNKSSWVEAKRVAESIRNQHQVEVWFITSKQQAQNMKGICSIMNGEFDIMLYRRGGKLC